MSPNEVYEVGSAIVARAGDGETKVAFCTRCDWSGRFQVDEDLARAIADHMRHWNRTHEELDG